MGLRWGVCCSPKSLTLNNGLCHLFRRFKRKPNAGASAVICFTNCRWRKNILEDFFCFNLHKELKSATKPNSMERHRHQRQHWFQCTCEKDSNLTTVVQLFGDGFDLRAQMSSRTSTAVCFVKQERRSNNCQSVTVVQNNWRSIFTDILLFTVCFKK